MPVRIIAVRSRSFTLSIQRTRSGTFQAPAGTFRGARGPERCPLAGLRRPAARRWTTGMGVQAGIRPGGMLAELAAEFPGWHVWCGRDGRGADQGWFATRRRRLSAAQVAAGLAATLSAGDAE